MTDEATTPVDTTNTETVAEAPVDTTPAVEEAAPAEETAPAVDAAPAANVPVDAAKQAAELSAKVADGIAKLVGLSGRIQIAVEYLDVARATSLDTDTLAASLESVAVALETANG